MKLSRTFLFGLCVLASVAQAQVAVSIEGDDIKVKNTGGSGSSVAVNTAGTIESDVEMEGVAVINGQVFIDGQKVPKGQTSYTSKKTGKSYLIKWGKNGNVAVQEK